MSIDVDVRALPATQTRPGSAPRALRISVPARAALAALAGASFVLRWFAGLAHVTPYYFSDEYTYSELARGIARHGWPVVRGAHVAFPALLEPALGAPLWLVAGQETVLEVGRALHALEVSLAAVPVYLLARRVRLSERVALLCAALSLCSPDLFWASFALADPLGYLLAVTAVYAGVVALERPATRPQLAFVGLATLAALARTQYAVLPFVFLAAALAVERGDLRQVARRHRIVVAAVALGIAAIVLGTIAGALGPYAVLVGLAQDPQTYFTSLGLDLLIVAVASGLVLVPGALVALDLALSHPRDRAEHALAALTLFLGAALVGLAALVPDTRILERYVFVLIPLLGILFAWWIDRGAPRRRAACALAGAVGAASLLVGLPGRDGAHSPTTQALHSFARWAGSGWLPGAFLASLAAASLVLAARARAAGVVAFALAGVAMVSLSAGAWDFDRTNARAVRDGQLPRDANWVDRANLGAVTLLHTPGASRGRALEQLFWNHSISRVALLPNADKIDFFASPRAAVRRDGMVVIGNEPIRTPLLVEDGDVRLQLAGVERVRQAKSYELWRPNGIPRVVTAISGWADGRLGRRLTVTVWPQAVRPRARELRLVLSLPRSATAPVRVLIRATPARPGPLIVVLRPGEREVERFRLGKHPLTLDVRAGRPGVVRVERPGVVSPSN